VQVLSPPLNVISRILLSKSASPKVIIISGFNCVTLRFLEYMASCFDVHSGHFVANILGKEITVACELWSSIIDGVCHRVAEQLLLSTDRRWSMLGIQ
jgi:hypothetical protein